MKTISQLFSLLLPLVYLLVVFLNAYIFFGRNKKFETKVPLIITLLIVIHAAHIILRGLAIKTLPLVTKLDALSLLAFTIVILILIIELTSENKTTIFFAVFGPTPFMRPDPRYFSRAAVVAGLFSSARVALN